MTTDLEKDEVTGDMLRSAVINSEVGFLKFTWAKEFVFSNELNKYVALAGTENELFLIDHSGEIIETLENE